MADRDRRPPAILLSHGSFNPVHRHHVDMMVRARQRLELAGYQVVLGVFGITNSDWIRFKGAAALSDAHRIAALELACAGADGSLSWLRPDARGVHFGSAGQMIRGLRDELLREVPGAQIFNVMGADVGAGRSVRGPRPYTVIVGRAGAKVERQEVGSTSFFLDEFPGNLSSTRVREALADGDEATVRISCSPEVADYLLAHREMLYQAPASSGAAGDSR